MGRKDEYLQNIVQNNEYKYLNANAPRLLSKAGSQRRQFCTRTRGPKYTGQQSRYRTCIDLNTPADKKPFHAL